VHEPGRRGPQSAQSVQGEQNAYWKPAPPSSQLPSPAKMHELAHVSWVPGGNGGGGEGRGGGGLWLKEQPECGPQSAQSVQGAQIPNSEPGLPSSQSPSLAKMHVLTHVPEPGGPGGGGGRRKLGKGGRKQVEAERGPQSAQSVQGKQKEVYSATEPPSSQTPLEAKMHVFKLRWRRGGRGGEGESGQVDEKDDGRGSRFWGGTARERGNGGESGWGEGRGRAHQTPPPGGAGDGGGGRGGGGGRREHARPTHGGDGGGGGSLPAQLPGRRRPQSAQSRPHAHEANSAPPPPSSQSPS
jgi:hypothetical protein